MKAEDLMIGDWVVEHDHGYNSDGSTWESDETTRITAINGYGVDTERNYHLRYDEIDPIPLTPAILEKNGFKKAESDTLSQTWAWAEKSEKIYNRWVQITFYNEPINGVSYLTKIETCSRKGDGVNKLHSCDIDSVHQLQHALRLCKIDLEINI